LLALALCREIKNVTYHRVRFTGQTILISPVFGIKNNMPNVNMCDSLGAFEMSFLEPSPLA
jgi:hypothetical protein